MKKKTTIIAGSRDVTNFRHVEKIVAYAKKQGYTPSKVLSGTARGADILGEQYAVQNDIPLAKYPADWNTHGKSAGYIRNQQMAKDAKMLLAVWDGESAGTKHMIDIAVEEGLVVFVNNLKMKRIYRINA